MVNTFWTAFATSALAAIVTTLGICTIRKYVDWGQRNSAYFMYFVVGVLISALFLHIILKSLTMNPGASIYLLVGFLVCIYLIVSLRHSSVAIVKQGLCL